MVGTLRVPSSVAAHPITIRRGPEDCLPLVRSQEKMHAPVATVIDGLRQIATLGRLSGPEDLLLTDLSPLRLRHSRLGSLAGFEEERTNYIARSFST